MNIQLKIACFSLVAVAGMHAGNLARDERDKCILYFLCCVDVGNEKHGEMPMKGSKL